MKFHRNMSKMKLPVFTALYDTFVRGYAFADFKSDVMAGIVVGMVAVPLGMALAIASGVAPQHGLYTVLIAGGLVALLGGSRFNVTGPTAAFVVILVPIAQQYGLGGLLLAGVMSGIILTTLGLTGLGHIIRLIPHPVTTGFTSGIAVVIATIQLKDFFGLQFATVPQHYWERVFELFRSAPTISLTETMVGVVTLALLLMWPKVNKSIPAPIVVLTGITLLTALMQKYFPSVEISTIGNRFLSTVNGEEVRGIPQMLPTVDLPWMLPAADGAPVGLSFATIKELLPSAFAIALLGAIESLLCAVVADGMTQTKHNPNGELLALGVGNIVTPFFGGIAATGAIARTATNIRFGAKSPLAAIIHALFTLVVLLIFAPYVSYLPMASMAALLMLIAYNMAEIKHFKHIVSVAHRSDVAVLLTCFFLTVVFDMIIGVGVGVGLATVLFLRRMAELSYGKPLEDPSETTQKEVPKDVLVYEIGGPLFFGAAEKAITGIGAITDSVKTVIFDFRKVPAIDITGMVAFESAVNHLTRKNRTQVFICGVQPAVMEAFAKSETFDEKRYQYFASVEEALSSNRGTPD